MSFKHFSLQSVSAVELSGSGWRLASPSINRFIQPQKRAVTNIVHKARTNYFSSKIAQSSCCKELFSVCDKLGGCKSDSPLPTTIPTCQLPDAFADYFVQKVKTIRNELDNQMPTLNLPTDDPYTEYSFCSFQPVSIQCVKNTILKSSQKNALLTLFPHPSLSNV